MSPTGARSVYGFKVPGEISPEEKRKKQEEERMAEEQRLAEEEQRRKEEEAKEEKARIAEQKKLAKKPKRKSIPPPPHPHEVSAKISGIVAQSFSVLGTGMVRFWPNALFGSNHSYLSRGRWGSGITYAQTVSGSIDYGYMEVPLYYKILPGYANRGPVFAMGPMYSSVNHKNVSWNGLATTFYFGSPMPKLLSSVFDLMFLRFPKYMEIEGFYAITTLSSDVPATKPIMGLSTRAKFFMSKRFFLEGNFYFRYHGFKKSEEKSRELTVMGGSAGIGYQF